MDQWRSSGHCGSKKDKKNHTNRAALALQVQAQASLQTNFGWNEEAARQCTSATDSHQVCLYDIFKIGSSFDCECRPTFNFYRSDLSLV